MSEYTVYGTAPSGNDFTAPVEASSSEDATETFEEKLGEDAEDFEIEGAEA